MVNRISELIETAAQLQNIYLPQILRLNIAEDAHAFEQLLREQKGLSVHDEIKGQLRELIKGNNPSLRIKAEEYDERIAAHLNGADLNAYGVWVFYPWSNRLVHLLDEAEFIEVRTNRNQYKITKKERDLLATKKIGIIGLSVGQSISLTLAMERGFGELRLADFDFLELSNLNRIRTGVHNLGVPKVVIAAREIAEIDPFLKVNCFFEGFTEQNMDEFLTGNGKLDILVDECDGLDIKIISRYRARELRIPVLMDTSDRGMLDVERFDLEPDRPILHGAVENIDPKKIKELSNEEKVPVVLQMLGIDNISLRAKASMVEVEQTINTWPQLASSVTLGGAVGADVCRRILLDQFHASGRYYIDLEEIVADEQTESSPLMRENPHHPISAAEMKALINLAPQIKDDTLLRLEEEVIADLVEAANAAPSTGNDQPWKWMYDGQVLYLFHDQYRSHSFGDFEKIASFLSFGAAYENLHIHALSMGLEALLSLFPVTGHENPVAAIRFKKTSDGINGDFLTKLDRAIPERHTNRNIAPRKVLDDSAYKTLKEYAQSIPGAKFQYFTDDFSLRELSDIIGACDRIRLLSKEGHYDFVHHEMRWTPEHAEQSRDGIDIKTLGLSNSQLAALGVLKNADVISTINDLEGGRALDMLAKRTVAAASALCIITLPTYNLNNYFEGGRSLERFWLAATNLGLAVHPLISPFYLFPRANRANGDGLSEKNISELKGLQQRFETLTHLNGDYAGVFLAKIAIAPQPQIKSFRLPLTQAMVDFNTNAEQPF
jgi:molybdopterin/thiamine biosynthesis adenylyltransferase